MSKFNEIEGFNPQTYARHITDSDGNDTLYLDVQYRKLWFRLANPNGKVVKKIHKYDNNTAVVEARVYLDRNDPEDAFISNAFAQRAFDPSNDFSSRYLESAETAAVGRALADAGYGLQFALEKDDTPVDMGQIIPKKVQSNETPTQKTEDIPPKPVFNESTPIEEIVQNMSYEDAVKIVYHCNGKHNGQTLGQLAIDDYRCITWLVESYKGKNNLLKGAAIVINNRHTGNVG